MGVIQCTDVEFSYGDTRVLDGASLEVGDGEFVALLGPSGSGKSTLLYCLAGVLTPTAGDVTVLGRQISAMSERERTAFRAQHCGFVLQFGRLVGDLSALENAEIPLRLLGAPRRVARATAREALDVVGVGHLADRRASSLSGGEQQRVAVARAVVHQPAVVFADEPTGALDSANGSLVLDCLVDLTRSTGTGLVMVTHDESVAARADRQIQLRDGVVRADAYG